MIDNNNFDSRRSFLKKMLTATVLTATIPHLVLGQTVPELKIKDNQLLGLFHIKLSDYPGLKTLWGSVRIRVQALDGSHKNIIICHVPKDQFIKEYTAVWEICTHMGYQISLLHPDLHIFICPHQGSQFFADGTYKSGPANHKDLEKYPVTYTDGDDLFVEIYYYVGVEDEIGTLAYLNQNAPNPCSTTTLISYGVEKPANVELALYNISGEKVLTAINSFHYEGHYKFNLNVSEMPQGNYFYLLTIDGKRSIAKKMVIGK